MDFNKLNQGEIATLLMVTRQSISSFQKENPPIPRHMETDPPHFRWKEVLIWHDRRIEASVRAVPVRRRNTEGLCGAERLALAKAELAELDLARARKETLTVADYEQAMTDLIVPARQTLLAIEARLRPVLGTENAAKVGQEIHRTLKAMGGTDGL